MSPEQERFMAFDGLLQWTAAVVSQGRKVSDASEHAMSGPSSSDFMTWHLDVLNFHSECHYFCIAAQKLIEYRDWSLSFGLCEDVDFSEVNSFSGQDIKDLRNMREHIVEYFRGKGHTKDRWWSEKSGGKADASSVVDLN